MTEEAEWDPSLSSTRRTNARTARRLFSPRRAAAERHSFFLLLLLLALCGVLCGLGATLQADPPSSESVTPAGKLSQESCVPAENTIDWAAAREEYFYLHKVMATELGRNGCDHGSEQHKYVMYRAESLQEHENEEDHDWEATLRANSGWLRGGGADPLVTRNALCNTDIRSHLRELFTFTLFFSPRTIVELGVRTGWSTRAFAAAAKLVGAKMIGIDLDKGCRDVYALAVGPQHGFAMVGDSAEAAKLYAGWVDDRPELALEDSVDLLFIDTSHEYGDTVRELTAWAPLMSGLCVFVCMPATRHTRD